MLQIDGVFQMLIQVHKEYNSLLPLEMQEQDEDWFDGIDEKMMSFKNKIHNWIRDAEHERKRRLSSKSRSVTPKDFSAESHHQVHPPADRQKTRKLYKKS